MEDQQTKLNNVSIEKDVNTEEVKNTQTVKNKKKRVSWNSWPMDYTPRELHDQRVMYALMIGSVLVTLAAVLIITVIICK